MSPIGLDCFLEMQTEKDVRMDQEVDRIPADLLPATRQPMKCEHGKVVVARPAVDAQTILSVIEDWQRVAFLILALLSLHSLQACQSLTFV